MAKVKTEYFSTTLSKHGWSAAIYCNSSGAFWVMVPAFLNPIDDREVICDAVLENLLLRIRARIKKIEDSIEIKNLVICYKIHEGSSFNSGVVIGVAARVCYETIVTHPGEIPQYQYTPANGYRLDGDLSYEYLQHKTCWQRDREICVPYTPEAVVLFNRINEGLLKLRETLQMLNDPPNLLKVMQSGGILGWNSGDAPAKKKKAAKKK